MSWKKMLVIATLSLSAPACKTVSSDNKTTTPAAVQEKAVPPAAPKVDPLTPPTGVESNKADETAKPEQSQPEDKSRESAGSSETEPKTEQ